MSYTLEKTLNRCPLFNGIHDLEFVSRCLSPITERLATGGRLDWRGGGFAALVLEGKVCADGAVHGPGAVLGLEAALLDGPRSAVIAQKPSALLLLPAKKLAACCAECCPEHRRLAGNTLRLLAEHSRALSERQGYLLLRGTRRRLCAYLLDQRRRAGADIFTLPLNRRAMAEYLNLSRPSLSRELCALRDEGAVEFYRETVKLLDPGKMAEINP